MASPDASPAPAQVSSVRFVFPIEWERRNLFGQQTITMTTQLMDPHDPMWGLHVGSPFTFVAIDNVATDPQLAFCATVTAYSAEPNQLFGDDGDFEGDRNELSMLWTLQCSHISSDPANLGRPPTDDEIDEWNEHNSRMLPITNPSPGLSGWFIPLHLPDEEPKNDDQLEEVSH